MKALAQSTNPPSGKIPEVCHDVTNIMKIVQRYETYMREHPLNGVMGGAAVPRSLLLEYAGLQYVDSVLWVPMLALMKDRAKNPRLRKALTDNILCEAGAKHTSHITLCMEFVKSIGVKPFYGKSDHYSNLSTHPIEMMNAVSGMSEAQIAGWALVAEAVVPSLFKMALPAYNQIEGADTTYLREHITVDSDEHAQWMLESVTDMLESGVEVSEILAGVHLGGRTALSVPDALYAKYLRGEYDQKTQ